MSVASSLEESILQRLIRIQEQYINSKDYFMLEKLADTVYWLAIFLDANPIEKFIPPKVDGTLPLSQKRKIMLKFFKDTMPKLMVAYRKFIKSRRELMSI